MSRVILKFDPRGSGLIKISMSVSTPVDSEWLAGCFAFCHVSYAYTRRSLVAG